MKRILIFVSGVLAAAGGAVGWWLHRQRSVEPRKDERKPPRAAAPEAPARPRKAAPRPDRDNGHDDLKRVEGIGPKIESLLKDAGIRTWSDLAGASASQLRSVLDEAGPRFRMHDPSSWPRQARLAAEGKWDDLAAYQGELKGGRKA